MIKLKRDLNMTKDTPVSITLFEDLSFDIKRKNVKTS